MKKWMWVIVPAVAGLALIGYGGSVLAQGPGGPPANSDWTAMHEQCSAIMGTDMTAHHNAMMGNSANMTGQCTAMMGGAGVQGMMGNGGGMMGNGGGMMGNGGGMMGNGGTTGGGSGGGMMGGGMMNGGMMGGGAGRGMMGW